MFHRAKVELEFKQVYKTVGLGLTIFSPLASGSLTNKYLSKFPENTRMSLKGYEWLKEKSITEEKLNIIKSLDEVAKDINTSLPKLGIAWCLMNKDVSTVILGASKVAQLEETLQAIDILDKLTPEVMDRIELILNNKPVLVI
jgi:aryl-alcohol dehydrogenase-like predicted oxidoreductase